MKYASLLWLSSSILHSNSCQQPLLDVFLRLALQDVFPYSSWRCWCFFFYLMIYPCLLFVVFGHIIAGGGCPMSPDAFMSETSIARGDKHYRENNGGAHYRYGGGGYGEMTPLTELPSTDDLTSNDVESWLETSSKYHSCEIVDTD